VTEQLLIKPNPADPRLTRGVSGIDHNGEAREIRVVEERPLTIYLNSQEIVTAMTIGDYPEYLAVGYLRNQAMLLPDDVITSVDFDEEVETVTGTIQNKYKDLNINGVLSLGEISTFSDGRLEMYNKTTLSALLYEE